MEFNLNMLGGQQKINGVFVQVYPPSWLPIETGAKATCPFWIGIDNLTGQRSDTTQEVNQVIRENPSLGMKLEFAMDYVEPGNFIGKGLQHSGLFFTWNWTVSEKQISEFGEQNHWKVLEQRAFDSIGVFITLLQSRGVRVSQQHPYSAKNTWLNHFRPTIELLMTLGRSFWLPALSMSVLCIDAAYQDSVGKQRDSYTIDMLRWVFDPVSVFNSGKELDKALDILAKGFANGLKHDTLVRDPIILENPKFENMLSEATFAVFLDAECTTPIFAVRTDRRNVEHIVVSPKPWWLAVRSRIDRHFRLLS